MWVGKGMFVHTLCVCVCVHINIHIIYIIYIIYIIIIIIIIMYVYIYYLHRHPPCRYAPLWPAAHEALAVALTNYPDLTWPVMHSALCAAQQGFLAGDTQQVGGRGGEGGREVGGGAHCSSALPPLAFESSSHVFVFSCHLHHLHDT
jgi:hypothetical protein